LQVVISQKAAEEQTIVNRSSEKFRIIKFICIFKILFETTYFPNCAAITTTPYF